MKRTLSIILSIIMASSFVCGLPVYAKESTNKSAYIIGDTDLDNVVTIKDATLLQFYIAKLAKLTDKQLLLADVDHDNVNTIKDTTCIQLYLAHVLKNTDIGTPLKNNTNKTDTVKEKDTTLTYEELMTDKYMNKICNEIIKHYKAKGLNYDTSLNENKPCSWYWHGYITQYIKFSGAESYYSLEEVIQEQIDSIEYNFKGYYELEIENYNKHGGRLMYSVVNSDGTVTDYYDKTPVPPYDEYQKEYSFNCYYKRESDGKCQVYFVTG